MRSTFRSFSLFTVLCALLAPGVSRASSSFELDQGWRQDHLDFNLAGTSETGTPVNVMSELSWRKIRSYQVGGKLRQDLFGKTLLEGTLSYGAIYAGVNQDSDFDGNNRTQEYSRSNNAADIGHLADGSLAIGQRFTNKRYGLTAALLAGYGFDQQHLYVHNGVQTIPADGPFAGLYSNYDTNWQGPWIGVEGRKQVGRRLALRARAEYHWADYSAHGNWNLRTDFAHPNSFTDSGHAGGDALSLAALYTFSPAWQVRAQAGLTNYTMKNGTDTVYFTDGTSADTPLNAVHWRSLQLTMGACYKF